MDGKTLSKAIRGTEYQLGAHNETLYFSNPETLGSRCPSDLESVHPSKCPSDRGCHGDSVRYRRILPVAGGSQSGWGPGASSQDKPRPPGQSSQAQTPSPLTLGCFSGRRAEDIHPSGLRGRHRRVLRQPQLHGRWDQTRLPQCGHFPSDRAGGQQSRVWQRRPVLTCNLYVVTVVDLWHNLNVASF